MVRVPQLPDVQLGGEVVRRRLQIDRERHGKSGYGVCVVRADAIRFRKGLPACHPDRLVAGDLLLGVDRESVDDLVVHLERVVACLPELRPRDLEPAGDAKHDARRCNHGSPQGRFARNQVRSLRPRGIARRDHEVDAIQCHAAVTRGIPCGLFNGHVGRYGEIAFLDAPISQAVPRRNDNAILFVPRPRSRAPVLDKERGGTSKSSANTGDPGRSAAARPTDKRHRAIIAAA